MGIIDEIKEKFDEFKTEQKKRSDFKKKLDFEKYKAKEIAKAKREIQDIREGKTSEITDKDILGYDPREITLR